MYSIKDFEKISSLGPVASPLLMSVVSVKKPR